VILSSKFHILFVRLEFVMHRELYTTGFGPNLLDDSKVKPHQYYEFARLNLNYTVMSKRKLVRINFGKHSKWVG
jgi:glutaminyl-tRNA synthetase